MSSRTDRPSVLRDSWRPEERDHTVSRRIKKTTTLLLVFMLLVGGIGFFFYLITEPILHPNTYLVLATGNSTEEIQPPPVHFSSMDLERFQSLEPALSQDSLDLLSEKLPLVSGGESNLLQERLNHYDLRSKDILILYIAAHGFVINGEPYLLSDQFNQTSPQVGSMAVRSLLELVNASNAKTKLLILDSGHLPFDPWMGNGANLFVEKLRNTIRKLKLNDLWVLASNDVCQYSSVSELDQTSVFSFYVREGLRGHGDLNSDGVVHLRELFTYVKNMVVDFTNKDANVPVQVPVLIGDAENTEDPLLISVKIGKEDLKTLGDESVASDEVESADGSGLEPPENEAPAGEAMKKGADSNSTTLSVSEKTDASQPVPSDNSSSENTKASQSSDSASTLVSLSDPTATTVFSPPPKPDLTPAGIVSAQDQQRLDRVWSNTYRDSQGLIGEVWDLYFSSEKN